MSGVCQNQDTFNVALRKAIKENEKENMKKAKPWIYVYIVLWAIFLVWGVMLAMQISDQSERIEHIVFAIVFGPVYVLSYYLGLSGNKPKMGMTCGSRY